MFGLGIGEVVVILVVALIFIGPKKLPELAKGLGKGLREFQKATKGITDSISEVNNQTSIETKDEEHSLGESKRKNEES